MKVLFLNHKIENCGVYQYGKRVFDILKNDTEIEYIYEEIDCYEEYRNVLQKSTDIVAIIYNYHCSTMPWLHQSNIQRTIKNIGIPHESQSDLFDIVCNIDPDAPVTNNCFSLPRPIFENIAELIALPTENSEINDFIYKYTDTNIPIFGSFGFGFHFKGFEKIIKLVNEQYDNAIIKFVIPVSHYAPDANINSLCFNENKKPGIKLLISNDFFSTNDMLKFLHSNTVNIFLYDKLDGRGISSTIDYALSVKKPLAISDSYMFRHIYSDEICLYKNTIPYCMTTSERYLYQFVEKYSNNNLRSVFKKMIV